MTEIVMDRKKQVRLDVATSGGAAYTVVPFNAQVIGVTGTLQASTGSTSAFDVTITSNSSNNSLGTLAFTTSSGSLSAGAVGSYSVDSSSGFNVLAASTVLKATISGASVSGSTAVDIEYHFDPYAF